MAEKKIKVWSPIAFSDRWLHADTSFFDELAASWYEKRKEFKEGSKDYNDFLDRLKRQHAIETGVIENLYDVSEGITQTFIKEGFVESFVGHDDTNIPPSKLIAFLRSHFEAMDFVFDLIKNNRPLTKSFILELYQLILKHQDYSDAIDSLGRPVKIKVLKGKFKDQPNNPKREDGTIFLYCPPVHVDAETERLLAIYHKLETQNVHPVIIASWFHHAFTQIHPFQDGNGRMARLLASLILIKHRLFPLNVLRSEKPEYIRALEKADSGDPNDLVRFFSKVQRRQIESALNIQTRPETLREVAEMFKERVEASITRRKAERGNLIEKNRRVLTEYIYSIIGSIQKKLFEIIPKDKAYITATSSNESNYYYYTRQIVQYANEHDYFFNKNLDRRWYRLSFHVAEEKRYDIVISIHHFGYSDSVVALGAFIQFVDKTHEDNRIEHTIPLNMKPYTLSLEQELSESSKKNIESYLNDVVKIGLSIISNEIS